MLKPMLQHDFATADRRTWVREMLAREKALAELIRKTRGRPILPAEKYRAALRAHKAA